MPPPTPPIVNDGRMMAGKADVVDDRQRLFERPGDAARRHLDADLPHRVAEQQPVLGHLDRVDRRANQLDVVLLEHAALVQRHRQVERRLAADGRQHRVRPLLGDDRLDHLRRQRLDVGAIGHLRVGHDRGRVAVDQHHLEPFGAQRLARLRARVVELARLADDDRARADDEDALDVSAFGHRRRRQRRLARLIASPSTRGTAGTGSRRRADPATPRDGTAPRRSASSVWRKPSTVPS